MIDLEFDFFVFSIDTTEYAENFDRELTAFCTGQLGDCHVGELQTHSWELDCPKGLQNYFNTTIIRHRDDQGCFRPCTMLSTPGFWATAYGGVYPDNKWDTKKKKYPAYQSVGILFEKYPNKKAIDYIINRSKQYRTRYLKEPINIINYRVLKIVAEQKELWKLNS